MDTNNIYLDDDFNDSESFLSEVPVNLLKENLINQFNSPSKFNTADIMKGFIQSYKYSKADAMDDENEDALLEIESIRSDFISFVLMLFKERFGIGMPNIGDASEEDQDELLHFTYRFFIMNIRKNFVNAICNYVIDHADELKGIGNREKDITTIAYKRELDEPYLQIISNLEDIVNHIFTIMKNEFTIYDFLNICDSEIPSLETQLVISAYDADRLTGNFVEKYINSVSDSLRFDIEVKVRNLLFNHFRKRDRKEDDNNGTIQEEES